MEKTAMTLDMTFLSREEQESDPRWLAFQHAARRYRDDAPWRARIDGGEAEAVSALMSEVALAPAPGASVRVRANDDRTFHVVMPPDPNNAIADETLSGVVGGVRAGTLGSMSTVGSMGCSCVPSSLGSALCAGTVGPDT